MKKQHRIKFDNFNGTWKIIPFIALLIVAVAIGFFEVIKFENEIWNKTFAALANLIPALFLCRMFIYKNYVQYNKRGIVIKVKSWSSKTLTFNEISDVKLEDEKLLVSLDSGRNHTLNLSHIVEEDRHKLLDLILNYSDLKLA
ncbi:hypothetical protein [Nonlabens ponticola]|uniref:Uncharacterized protein n=1 Tax=Nonlabens ponticola TaxID=2496866 RepID=A0A3S9MZH5_9FLAO|nr:hypothetical protein [Nonlabens ponticola]AZQ44557.1 hypothetical protein EJ995_09985 [Nonlabens ponticola]